MSLISGTRLCRWHYFRTPLLILVPTSTGCSWRSWSLVRIKQIFIKPSPPLLSAASLSALAHTCTFLHSSACMLYTYCMRIFHFCTGKKTLKELQLLFICTCLLLSSFYFAYNYISCSFYNLFPFKTTIWFWFWLSAWALSEQSLWDTLDDMWRSWEGVDVGDDWSTFLLAAGESDFVGCKWRDSVVQAFLKKREREADQELKHTEWRGSQVVWKR